MGFIDSNGNYYEGMKAHKSHIEVPERPHGDFINPLYYSWDGEKWVENTAAKKADEDLVALDKMIQDEIKEIAIKSLKDKGLIS